jgi:hypothetical protein
MAARGLPGADRQRREKGDEERREKSGGARRDTIAFSHGK